MQRNEQDLLLQWNEIAENDLKMANIALEKKMNLYAAFHCQQSIEKSLKALFIFHNKETPPLIHDINKLYLLVVQHEKELQFDPEFLIKLSSYYITTRYPSYKRKVEEILLPSDLNLFFKYAKEVLVCLKQKLK
jgi:HEPN domain-containing protein